MQNDIVASHTSDLAAQIIQTDDKRVLEKIGSELDPLVAPPLFTLIKEGAPEHHWKISALLVGMPPAIFQKSLMADHDKYIECLKQEASLEPLQHQLKILLTDYAYQTSQLSQLELLMKEELKGLDVLSLTPASLTEIEDRIDQMIESADRLIKVLNKVLLMTWNSGRTDLVEHASFLKEVTEKMRADVLYGELKGLLDFRLYSVFGPLENQAALADSDPSLDGLTRLSIWYPEDFYKLGLIKNEEDLTGAVTLIVQSNLICLGLDTVGSLKKQRIFSKPLLEAYLKKSLP